VGHQKSAIPAALIPITTSFRAIALSSGAAFQPCLSEILETVAKLNAMQGTEAAYGSPVQDSSDAGGCSGSECTYSSSTAGCGANFPEV